MKITPGGQARLVVVAAILKLPIAGRGRQRQRASDADVVLLRRSAWTPRSSRLRSGARPRVRGVPVEDLARAALAGSRPAGGR